MVSAPLPSSPCSIRRSSALLSNGTLVSLAAPYGWNCRSAYICDAIPMSLLFQISPFPTRPLAHSKWTAMPNRRECIRLHLPLLNCILSLPQSRNTSYHYFYVHGWHHTNNNTHESWGWLDITWLNFQRLVEQIIGKFFFHAISHWIQILKKLLKPKTFRKMKLPYMHHSLTIKAMGTDVWITEQKPVLNG